MCTVFLVLPHVYMYGLLDFGVHHLHEIRTLGPLLSRLRPPCAPMILDQSAVLIKVTTLAHVVVFEQPSMLFA